MDEPDKAKLFVRPGSEVLRDVDVANLAKPKDEMIARRCALLFECSTEIVVSTVTGKVVNLNRDQRVHFRAALS